MRNKKLQMICEAAIMIALSAVLSLPFFKIETGGYGGSIDFVMIPLFVFALRWGCGWGVLAGGVFGLIKCLIGGGIGYGLPSILLDYVVAYAAVGIAGVAKGKKLRALWGTLVGCVARFAVHFVSGITIYKILEPTEVAGLMFTNAWFYSLIYNALYMLPNTIVAVVLVDLLAEAMKKTKYQI